MSEPEFRYTTAELAAEFGIHKNTLRKRAARLGIGIDLEGRAGYRYSEADRAKLVESLRPTAPVTPRKRRRVA